MTYRLNLIKRKAPPPKKRKLSRIALKFSGLISLILLAVIFIMATLIFQKTRDTKIEEMEIRAQFFARDVREAMLPKPELFQLFFSVQEMAKEEAILYAMVLDNEKKIIAHSTKERIGEKDESEISQRAVENTGTLVQIIERDKEIHYDVSVPITIGGKQRIGTARIGFSNASINLALAEIRSKIIKLTVLVLVSGIAITILALSFMVHPINHLAHAANEVGKGNLNQRIDIRSRDEIGELADTFNNMVKGLKERDVIRNTFGKYVTDQVAEEILGGKYKLGGDKLMATVLLCDIRNFTSFSDKYPPEEVVEFLNKYFTMMVDVVFKYKGTLDKFMGDAFLAVFGAPVPHEDDALRAIWAALEMKVELERFNKSQVSRGKERIRAGIAIHTGEVVAGNIGSEKRMEYTVVGDTVNMVARLEELNKEFRTDILISKETYENVRQGVTVKEMPPVRIRGKEDLVQVYHLQGLGG